MSARALASAAWRSRSSLEAGQVLIRAVGFVEGEGELRLDGGARLALGLFFGRPLDHGLLALVEEHAEPLHLDLMLDPRVFPK